MKWKGEDRYVLLMSEFDAYNLRTSTSTGQWLDILSKRVGRTSLRRLVDEATEVIERHYIEAALDLAAGNRTVAAELLGISRQSLYVKFGRYGLDGEERAGAQP